MKLASSGSLDGISKLIAEFYCGESKELRRDETNDRWTIHGARGQLAEVEVRKLKKRFVFQTVN